MRILGPGLAIAASVAVMAIMVTAPRPGAAVNWRNWVNLAVGAMLPKGRWQ